MQSVRKMFILSTVGSHLCILSFFCLQEYQSFTDLQFSKEKQITCIQWHPVIKGVVAVAVAEKLTFDERIDNAAKIIMTPSLILIWSFTDPIHPQVCSFQCPVVQSIVSLTS